MRAIAAQAEVPDPYVDGLLGRVKWAEASLTFAFPSDPAFFGTDYRSGEPADNFAALTGAERTSLREALQAFATVSGLTFSESSGADSGEATLRVAKTDATGAAWTYAPGPSDKSGDVWFSNAGDVLDGARPGNHAWFTMLHELGHAVGLKHPHEVQGAFPAMPEDRDSIEFSVMSYRSHVGVKGLAYENGDASYPQSLMMYDIAALQAMYGANFAYSDTDTTYAWNAKTGQLAVDGARAPAPVGAKVFLTIWDGGGNDTYSFASYRKNLKVDLSPGGWTLTAKAQLAALGSGHSARGNIANALLHDGDPRSLIENAIGGRGNDRMLGNEADNALTGGGGNDRLVGKGGVDTAAYAGKASSYTWIEKANGSWLVTDSRKSGKDGHDKLFDIEVLQFKDGEVSLVDEAGQATERSPARSMVSVSPNASASADASHQPRQELWDKLITSNFPGAIVPLADHAEVMGGLLTFVQHSDLHL